MTTLDLSPDDLLTTTRSVRRRLDLTRAVEPEVLRACVEIALQAPIAPAFQSRIRFLAVTDPDRRQALAGLYRRAMEAQAAEIERITADLRARGGPEAAATLRLVASSSALFEHLHEVPVHVVPCVVGRAEGLPVVEQSALWGSVYPATWSLLLAARARGLGGVVTGGHLVFEREAAEVLGVPYEEVMQVALVPLAYTLGTAFKPGPRPPLDGVLRWDRW